MCLCVCLCASGIIIKDIILEGLGKGKRWLEGKGGFYFVYTWKAAPSNHSFR